METSPRVSVLKVKAQDLSVTTLASFSRVSVPQSILHLPGPDRGLEFFFGIFCCLLSQQCESNCQAFVYAQREGLTIIFFLSRPSPFLSNRARHPHPPVTYSPLLLCALG